MTIKRDGWVAFSDDHVAVATCEGGQVTTEVHAYPEGAGRMSLGVSVWTRNGSGGYDVNSADTSIPRQVAVAWLRHALREFAGPSIDDVREVWGDQRIWIRWWANPQPDMSGRSRDACEVVDRMGRGILDGRQRFATEREALQAAYDAGVAQRVGTTP